MDSSAVCDLHQRNRYDLILLDLHMSGMDGFQVMRGLREVEAEGYIPVLVVTALPDHKLRALQAGAKDFISKPFDPVEVLTRIHNMLEVRLLLRESRRKDAARHALQMDGRYRGLLEAAPDAMVVVSEGGQIVLLNVQAERQFGYSRDELVGQKVTNIIPEGFAERLLADGARSAAEALAQQIGTGIELSARRKDGSEFPIEIMLSPLEGADGVLVTAAIRDVSVRRRMTDALRQREAQLAAIYDGVGDPIYLLAVEPDDCFRFLSVNHAFLAATGLREDQVLGKRIEEVLPESSHALVIGKYRQAMLERRRVGWEEVAIFPTERKVGEVTVSPLYDDNGSCTHLVGWVRDVTEMKRSEERREHLETQLRQSQKLEAIGSLAAGVAHDFNNILGVIIGYGELAQHQLEPGHPVRPRVDQILKAGQRAAHLTRQLLAFSRKQVLQPKLLDLNTIVADTHRMLGRLIGEDLKVVARPALALGTVNADPGQVEQIILNLAVNARDAMPKGGSLTLETANVDLDEAYASAHPPATPGRYVMLAVSDTGIGMDPETQQRMFEPFFTTKPEGQGTGLGLATVYGIVKQSGGHIWVYSEPGRGTTFKVYLPRVDELAEVALQGTAPLDTPRGHETILVVEDSEPLREVVREALEDRGYEVRLASNGEEALALARGREGPIDLLLTDVVMPKLGGGDLARMLSTLRPGIRVLYMSGYTSGAILHQGALGEGVTLLEKPFTTDKLARAVREALDRPSASVTR
jgi:PAS domain S-box-containing protein